MDTLKQARHIERKYADIITIMSRFTYRITAYMQYLKFKNRGLAPFPLRDIERSKAMTKKDTKKIVAILKEHLPKLSQEKQEYLLGLAEGMEMARVIAEDKEEKAS